MPEQARLSADVVAAAPKSKASRSGPKRSTPALRVGALHVSNWKNYKKFDVELANRTFLVGPNASGKSNFLDILRFLRDIAKDGGGLTKAVADRGGVSKIRALSAGRNPNVAIDVALHLLDEEEVGGEPMWRYRISFTQDNNQRTILTEEQVWRAGKLLLDRPNRDDDRDPMRKTQTALEQITANQEFREISVFFKGVSYLHLIPQLIKDPETYLARGKEDYYGRGFLEKLAKAPERTQKARLREIGEALRIAVPNLENLEFFRDDRGEPHLKGRYRHWRPNAGYQTEAQFSDGTLRLLGLLWSLLDGDGLLLLEEPELSLHAGVARQIAPLIHKMQTKRRRQVIISTHSADLLSGEGIGGEEVLLLRLGEYGTEVSRAVDMQEIRTLLEAGMTVSEVVIPWTEPPNVRTLDEFF